MRQYNIQCPNCKNWVEGKVKQGLIQKLTRNAVNKGGAEPPMVID